jgi:hypothetical protein
MPSSATAVIASHPIRDLTPRRRPRAQYQQEKRRVLAAQRTIYWPQACALAALASLALMLIS